jgi:hypothetical protein
MFRKRPIVVEARQLTPENGPELWEWADSKPHYGPDGFVDGLTIYTLEGRMCKPDIFEATYEPAAEAAS